MLSIDYKTLSTWSMVRTSDVHLIYTLYTMTLKGLKLLLTVFIYILCTLSFVTVD